MTTPENLQQLVVPISKLVADKRNARKHTARNLDAIKESLETFGQLKPIVVQRQGMIVRAGNGTMKAAIALGWKTLLAVVVDLTDEAAERFAIADNRTSELAEWDEKVLRSILSEMDADARLSAGFTDPELDSLLEAMDRDTAALLAERGRPIPGTTEMPVPSVSGGPMPTLTQAMDYRPVTEPVLRPVTYSEGAITQASQGLQQMTRIPQSLLDVCCPHCGQNFQINK